MHVKVHAKLEHAQNTVSLRMLFVNMLWEVCFSEALRPITDYKVEVPECQEHFYYCCFLAKTLGPPDVLFFFSPAFFLSKISTVG